MSASTRYGFLFLAVVFVASAAYICLQLPGWGWAFIPLVQSSVGTLALWVGSAEVTSREGRGSPVPQVRA